MIEKHRESIDKLVEKTRFPYEVRKSLVAFYRTETLSDWLFYKRHVDMLLDQYGIKEKEEDFYWSTVGCIKTYSDMYLYNNLGLVESEEGEEEEEEEEGEEEERAISIPIIIITQH